MRILVTGAAGRLGTALVLELASAGHDVMPLGRCALDIRRPEAVDEVVGRLRPDVIANCASFNAVDAAEIDPPAAFAINAHGPANLARAARAVGALLVHYSTDYVFDGRASEPYDEDAPTNPLSVYGASKLAGEHEAAAAPRHYVLRLESLFGGSSGTGQRATIDRMLDSILAGAPVRAAVDRTVSPSYVPDVVRATRRLIELQAPQGTYHCVASGVTTWYDVATTIGRGLGMPGCIAPVTSAELQMPASRPQYCALSNRKIRLLGIRMPGWPLALRRHIAARRFEMRATLSKPAGSGPRTHVSSPPF
jgi:dTDP-4-dehydrorhamnose reductase